VGPSTLGICGLANALCVGKIRTGIFEMINPIVAIAALFLIGFQETAEGTASDVSEASIEVIKSVADARKDANEIILKANEGKADAINSYASSDAEAQAKLAAAQADAMSERARAEYYLAMATARGNYRLAAQKCDALDRGAGRMACKNTADTMLAIASGDAAAMRDAALMAAADHE
jgi:hypothetical protein